MSDQRADESRQIIRCYIPAHLQRLAKTAGLKLRVAVEIVIEDGTQVAHAHTLEELEGHIRCLGALPGPPEGSAIEYPFDICLNGDAVYPSLASRLRKQQRS